MTRSTINRILTLITIQKPLIELRVVFGSFSFVECVR